MAPNIFKETKKEPMQDLIASQQFGTIVSMHEMNAGLTA
jgi:predicted FMN-binding regulatory protein PaiB